MTPEQADKLREPFPQAVIGQLPRGGVMLDYVGHAAVTDRLLQVDPEWHWEPLGLDPQGLPAIDAAGNLWIKLTVCGVTRIGCGDGKNMKERIGDAIRNAAMRFGVALDLWAKEDLQAMHERREQEPPPQEETGELMQAKTRARLFALMAERGVTEREAQIAGIRAVIGREIESRGELTEAEAQAVIRSLKGAA